MVEWLLDLEPVADAALKVSPRDALMAVEGTAGSTDLADDDDDDNDDDDLVAEDLAAAEDEAEDGAETGEGEEDGAVDKAEDSLEADGWRRRESRKDRADGLIRSGRTDKTDSEREKW